MRSIGSKEVIIMQAFLFLFSTHIAHAQLPPVIDLGNFAEDVRIASNIEELFGSDLAVGDFNGDGYADILAGAYGYSIPQDFRFNVGRAYIIFGGASLSPSIDLRDSSVNAVTITGDDPRDFTGFTVAAGDINGDGISDAIVSTSQFTHPVAKGRVYIIYGKKIWPEKIDLDTDDSPVSGITRVIGSQPGSPIGEITAIGDIDGDGFADLVTGAPGAGREHAYGRAGEACILYGHTSLGAVVELGATDFRASTIHGSDNWKIGEFGNCLDVNNDGYWDILLGNTLFAEPVSENSKATY